MLSFLSKTVMAKPFKDYHALSENRVASENYEVRKLINGEIEALLYVKDTNTVLVMAGGYLWKINEHGYVIDTLSGGNALHNSGLQLWTDSWRNGLDEHFWYKRFSDWVYTGNKSEQTIRDVVSTDKMPDEELLGHLDKAEIVEFFSFYKDRNHKLDVCLLKTNDRWTVLDITRRLGQVDGQCREYRRRNKDIWQETCLEGYEKKYSARLKPLPDSLPFRPDWGDKSQPIYMQKFAKDFYYYEEGFGGWLLGKTVGKILKNKGLPGSLPDAYWYGTGYFQINHRSEQLKFKAFVSQEKEAINFKNLSMYGFSDAIFAAGGETRFLEIAYRGAEYNYLNKQEELVKYHEQDVGLYVIRKKSSPAATATYQSRNSWQPVFTGMASKSSIWGDIGFYRAVDEAYHYLLDVASVPEELHAIPNKLSFNWQGKNTRSAFKLFLNENNFAWYHMRHNNTRLFLEMVFDKAEMLTAFEQLNVMNQPLQLEVHLAETVNIGAALSVRLRNSKQSIELKNITFIPTEPRYGVDEDKAELTQKFEKSKLKIDFENALNDKHALRAYLDDAADIAANSAYIKEYAVLLGYYSNTLLNKYTTEKDYKVATIIIEHFIDKLLPYTGKVGDSEHVANNIEVIASNSLAIASITQNDKLKGKIFENLLGHEFEITAIKNATLLFNLACHYAVKKQKDSLLAAMQQALLHGKKADKFMTDTDFTAYWRDADFLRILNASGQ